MSKLVILLFIIIVVKIVNLQEPCKLSHLGMDFTGRKSRTESGVVCQNWDSESPHKTNKTIKDFNFEVNKKNARNFCRNPTKSNMGPWCYTLSKELQYETCGIPLCSSKDCRITGPGMEYSGLAKKTYSGKKCFKWNKKLYAKSLFPDEDFPGKACRNPSGDPGGPWCFVDGVQQNKEYCDVPFCEFSENIFTVPSKNYGHFTSFNESADSFTFGIKLWSPDLFLEAQASLVLSLLALPLNGSDLEDLGVGLEIYIGHNSSSLRFGSKGKDLEVVYGLINAFNLTYLTVNWHRGFITLSRKDQNKPIFLEEFKTKNTLLGHKKDSFPYYSMQGSNILWDFPLQEETCQIHTTTSPEFQQFKLLRESEIGLNLNLHLRCFHSCQILLTQTPTSLYPKTTIILSGKDNLTKILLQENHNSRIKIVQESEIKFLNYWAWKELQIEIFKDTLQVFLKKPIGLQKILHVKDQSFELARWYSISSHSLAHWTFFCLSEKPIPQALLPECSLNEQILYNGTQSVTSIGTPCLPWSASSKILGEENTSLFKKKKDKFQAWNYCRDPLQENLGNFCLVFSFEDPRKVHKQFCHVRKCKSEECKMAGTGNDYIGQKTVSRSQRNCINWDLKSKYNDSLFSDLSLKNAKNFCRNPSRDSAGVWCFTEDPEVPQDLCQVEDCDKEKSCTIIASTSTLGRKVFILPSWKESGPQTGLKFAIKDWNPDMLDGLVFKITPQQQDQSLKLVIGANYNELLELYYNEVLQERRTFPHLIAAGRWAEFWLQIGKGTITLGFQGIPTGLFEWSHKNASFEPFFLEYSSVFGKPLGIHFSCNECHTENVTVSSFWKIMPLNIWNKQQQEKKLILNLRGSGTTQIALLLLHDHKTPFFVIKINPQQRLISFVKNENFLNQNLDTFRIKNDKTIYNTTSWTQIEVNFVNEHQINIAKNNRTITKFVWEKPLIFYWFSVSAENGWVTWSANCEALDLDESPRNGGWSPWSPWICSVTCGGGQGYRTRTCNNPKPNIFGKLCHGKAIMSGQCNEFECGDLSPQTINLIQDNLQSKAVSLTLRQGQNLFIKKNENLLKQVQKEAPKSYFEWTLNGLLLKTNEVNSKNVTFNDSGVYICLWLGINGRKLVFQVFSLSVITNSWTIVTRASRTLSLSCNGLVLSFAYSNLNSHWFLNNRTFKHKELTDDILTLKDLKENLTGIWSCVVEQKELNLKWTTSYIKVLVKKKPNFLTNLMEDSLTKPLFGKLKSEEQVFWSLIFIVFLVSFLVVISLVLYVKFCTLSPRIYERN